MKQYLVLILAILVLALGLLVGCAELTTTYHNSQYRYSVQMPKSWEVVERPLDITGKPMENTIGFRSELSPGADWVYVEVMPGKSAYGQVTNPFIPPNAEYKLYEYGKEGYIVESRLVLLDKEPRISYYIEYSKRLYKITFNRKSTTKKVYVSIDGYGKVNY